VVVIAIVAMLACKF